MSMKTIWFINEYAGSPYHGMQFRHYYLGKELIKYGYNVWIITASYSHLRHKQPLESGIEKINGVNYFWIKVNKYSHAHDKKRILKWFIFSIKLFMKFKKLPKPNYIYVSSPFLLPIVPAYWFKKQFRDLKLIFEVRDIWPLTLIELGGYSKTHPFVKFLEYLENFALTKADILVSVLNNFGEYLKDKNINREWVFLPNGISLSSYEEESLPEWFLKKIPRNNFIVAYTGSINISNALDTLMETAKLLKERKDIKFLIVGSGNQLNKLIRFQKMWNLNNVVFINPISRNQVLFFLKKFADVTYKGSRNSRLYRYGISPLKLFDYMYAKKPIVHAINTKNDLVSQAKCGINVEAENPKAIADAILKFYKMPEKERRKIGENGYNFLLKNHTYERLAKRLVEEVLYV